jgi:hypothetical protein
VVKKLIAVVAALAGLLASGASFATPKRDTSQLDRAVQAAQAIDAQGAFELEACYLAMVRVRNEIRRFDGIAPQADLEVFNFFPRLISVNGKTPLHSTAIATVL